MTPAKPASFFPRRCYASTLIVSLTCLFAPCTALAQSVLPSPPVVGAKDAPKPVSKSGAQKKTDGTPVQVSTAELIYQYLISEIAGQRGGTQLAARGMLDLAQKTRDPRVARRAAEIAFQSRQTTEARDALLLWLALEPDAAVAHQALGALLGVAGPIEPVAATLTQWLNDKSIAPALFEQLPFLLSRYSDRAQVATIVAEAALAHLHVAEAQYAVGVTAFAAGRIDVARAAINAALAARPNFPRAAIAKAQLLRADGSDAANDAAMQYLAGYLKQFERDTEVRVAYARLLVGDKALLSAREEFRRAAQELPRDGELVYAVALISLQIEDWDAASAGFKRTLEMDPRDKSPIHYNLALAAEGKKDIEQALAWYRLIREGEYFVNAQVKIAGHIAKRDGLESGRKYLQQAQLAETESTDRRTQLVIAEVQLLRDVNALSEAHQVLTAALAKQPESIVLRYDRAMIAEKLNRLDEMESDLRTVINIKPDHAHAYNALGYTFAERGIRLPEAIELIHKAIALAPEDAFILDSLGWVQYRLKRNDEALATLTRAYRLRADPEIAAHLGEVLWVTGRRDDAQKVWQRALLANPDNPTLMALIERFKK